MKIDTTKSDLFPADLLHFLWEKHVKQAISSLTDITLLSPSEFVSINSSELQYLLDFGFNGSVFLLDSSTNCPQVLKISHTVLAAFGLVELNPEMLKNRPVNLSQIRKDWSALENTKVLRDMTIYSKKHIDRPLGITPVITEVWGTALWSLYHPQDLLRARTLTRDGLGLTRPYIPGFTLREAIENNKHGLVGPIKMDWIWRSLVDLQKVVDQMLSDLGLAVDLLNPANILITGKWPNWQLRLIDQELVKPTDEAIEYRRRTGLTTGHDRLSGIDCYVHWPLIPEHIVVSKVWNLSFEQSIQYISIYHNISASLALKCLATLPDLKNEINPNAQDYSNRNQARVLLNKNENKTLNSIFIK